MLHRLAVNCVHPLIKTAIRPVQRVTSLSGGHLAIRHFSSSETSDQFEERIRQLKIPFQSRKYRLIVSTVKEAVSLLEKIEGVKRTDLQVLLNHLGEKIIELPLEERRNLLNKAWAIIHSKFRDQLDISHYNAYLTCLIENKVKFIPAKIIEQLEEVDICPNRTTYECLIEKFCLSGDIEGGTKVVTFMRENDVHIGKPVFDSFLFGYAKIFNLDDIENTLSYMTEKKCPPDSLSYSRIIMGLIESTNQRQASQYITNYFDLFVRSSPPNCYLWQVICSFLKYDPSSNLLNEAFRKLGEDCLYDGLGVMYELINCKKVKEAYRVLSFLPSRCENGEVRQAARLFIIRLIGLSYQPDVIFHYCNRLKHTGLNPHSYSIASESAQIAYPPERSKLFLEKFIQLSGKTEDRLKIHYVGPTILHSNLVVAQGPVSNFQEVNLEVYTKNLRSTSDLNKILAMRKALISKGTKPSISIESQLVLRLLDAKKFGEAFDICEKYLNEGSYLLPNVLKRVINTMSTQGRIELLRKIEPKLPQQLKDDMWYKERLIEAMLTGNKIDELLEILPHFNPFPHRSLMSLLEKRPEVENKFFDRVLKIQSEELHNQLWTFYMIKGKWDRAQKLFDLNPSFKTRLKFTNIITEIRKNHNLVLADKSIEVLNTTELSPRSIALFYSAKIDVLTDQNLFKEAEDLILSLEKLPPREGANGRIIPPVSIHNINRITLVRLNNKISDIENREAKFELPLKDDIEKDESEAMI